MMRFSVRPLELVIAQAVVLLGVLALAGCAVPPSVTPLLRVTERALLEEAQRLEVDARRGDEMLRMTLANLEDGYRRDLDQTDELTPAWVSEATAVYVAAREAVIEHRVEIANEYNTRTDNLMTAAAATRRAVTLIERQDRLFGGVPDEDLRRLMIQAGLGTREPIR